MRGIIMKALSGFYYVYSDHQIYTCKARGKFRKMSLKPLVGDYCEFQVENNNEGYILSIDERTNSLVRPPIANIDQAYILVSAKEPDFQRMLLHKFLLVIEHLNIHPIIVVTKMDLADTSTYEEIELLKHDGYEVYPVSVKDNINLDKLKETFRNKVSVFTGQSGVGKSSLLNCLNPNIVLETNEISKALGRGRHTTRHVELFELCDGLVADSPGFSQLELTMDKKEAAVSYHDFKELSYSCKFRGCLHMNEPECAVKEAVNNHEINPKRYDDYIVFMNEILNRKEKY